MKQWRDMHIILRWLSIKITPITVHDDGRGIPVDIHPKTGKSALETIFTVLHAGGKFEKDAYKISGWLHGVWSSVVNALSERLKVTVHKNGQMHEQLFHIGVPQGDINIVGETEFTWTSVSFMPDETMFETIEFIESMESQMMKHNAYLTPGTTFTFIDERSGKQARYCFEGGIKTRLHSMIGEQEGIDTLQFISAEGKECHAEIAFQFINGSNDNVLSFVNNISTKDGGTHVLWFKSALLTVVNELAMEKEKINKKIGEFTYQDISDGLYAIISVKIPEPQFQWQTKSKLGNSYVRTQVEKICTEHLRTYFAENEDAFERVFEKVELAARARLAARIAKETVMRKNVLAWWVLPGKLSDCSRKGKNGTELFIVEGDSAGGTAKQWRDSEFQAILPLRGKILNTEQAHIQKILANKEVKNLITAIGCGLKDWYDEEALRYDKIVVMTDADVDGAHIRTLALTFFFRFMRPLIENGHLYIACPPIYKITQGKKQLYVYPPVDPEIENVVRDNGFDITQKYEVQRYKWLGEMNADQLRETTMDPSKRKMYKIAINEAEEADRMFRILMGEDVQSRKHFILTHAKQAEVDV